MTNPTQTQIRPKLSVTKIEIIYVEPRTYNVLRSIADASIKSIECYEISGRWWCEKRTFGKIKWVLEPAETDDGHPAVIVSDHTMRAVLVATPSTVTVEGRDYDVDAPVAFMPKRNVPYATPITLRSVVDKINEIVEW